MSYWQIAAGAYGRDYADVFLRHGMAFVGGADNVACMEQVELGDVVVLKNGMRAVAAAGQVVERHGKHRGKDDKDWLLDFDGWSLSAYCHVDWHVPPRPIEAEGLARGAIQGIDNQSLRALADKIIGEHPANHAPAPDPRKTRAVSDDEMLEFLIRLGLRASSAEDLTHALKRIRLLAKYYYDNCPWESVREHEIRTYLIVPLLLALGWSEQQMKIELPLHDRRRADVACFSSPYAGDNDDCALLIESKGFSQGLGYAADQASEYARQFSKCHTILVSNGYCYKAYCRGEDGTFSMTPTSYLNLLNPRDRYPLDPEHVAGCLETLKLLIPG